MAASSGSSGDEPPKKADTALLVTGTAAVLAAATTLGATVWREPLEDLVYGDGLYGGDAAFGGGDLVAALLWAASLYFCSPIQLLALFFGSFDRDRPSDWLMNLAGRALGYDVDAVDYATPAWLRAATVAAFTAAGFGIAWSFEAALGDATWGVSSGLGACMGAAMYEAGRPRRLSRDEAVLLEAQWQDFARFANARMQRAGRCHESEVFRAFRREVAGYRSEDVLPDATLRDMVRNWAPDLERTSTGFLKGVSLRPRADAFTGETTGYAVPAAPQQAAQAAAEEAARQAAQVSARASA